MTLTYKSSPEQYKSRADPNASPSHPVDDEKEGVKMSFYTNSPYARVNLNEEPDEGFGSSLADSLVRGAALAGKGLAVGVGAITAGAIYVAMTPVDLISTGFLKASSSVIEWARSVEFGSALPEDESEQKCTLKRLLQERAAERFEKDWVHVAVCGPSGSGKSSLINALRGVRNKDPEAAATGTVETTMERMKYQAHESFGQMMLYDCPGAGTQRNPSDQYDEMQKLQLFNLVLIVHGERLGEIEITTMRHCVARRQPCIIVRSRSDEITNRIKRDEEVDTDEAKAMNKQMAMNAFQDEFRRAGLPEAAFGDMADLYMIVNNMDLRKLASRPRDKWPAQEGEMEMDERRLIQGLDWHMLCG